MVSFRFWKGFGASRSSIPDGFDNRFIPLRAPSSKRMQRTVVRPMAMSRALTFSVLIHVAGPLTLLTVSVLLMVFFGLNLFEWMPHARPKPQDLEFVLTPTDRPEQRPIDPKTHYRAIRSARAGGTHRAERPVVVSNQTHSLSPLVMMTQARETSAPQKRPPVTHPVEKRPAAIVVADTVKPVDSASVAPEDAHSASAIPAGAEANAAQNTNTAAVSSVDALAQPDFGPYMKDLQKRIHDSWHPPRGNDSKRVVVVFRIDKGGALKDVQVTQSSGEPTTDQAAILAVRQIFPFRPLPEDYRQENIDIEFTFDYNVFGDRSRTAFKSG